MVKSKLNSRRKHRKTLILICVVTVLLCVSSWFVWRHYHNKPKISPVPTPTITQLPTTSTNSSAQKNVNTPTSSNSGNATDNNGQVSTLVTTPSSQWIQSQSGVITVKQPVSGAKISSGATLIGVAKVSRIQFRLMDNQTGVISQGFINVVGGNFSANINFQSHGPNGRLDVFTADDNGVESNEVQIPVNF